MDKRMLIAAGVIVVAGVGAWLASERTGTDSAGGAPLVTVKVPELSAAATAGKDVYDAKCSECHGANAAGVDGKGPPLVHKIYEPGHHADFAFMRAVAEGTRQHHWKFGDMKAVPGVGEADTKKILVYVRELQRANGIN